MDSVRSIMSIVLSETWSHCLSVTNMGQLVAENKDSGQYDWHPSIRVYALNREKVIENRERCALV